MCRYCKKLKELNRLREKNLIDCINRWKCRDEVARLLILQLKNELVNPSSMTFRLVLCDIAFDFLNTDYIGKRGNNG